MKTKNLILTLTLSLFTVVVFAQGVITGSSHDFSALSWNNESSGEICNACHTPHNATVISTAPLWDRVTVFNTGATWTSYSSDTFNADDDGTGSGGTGTAYVPGDPTGVSLLCLTCHDGVTPLDNSGTDTGTVILGDFIKNGGTDDHPISIDYTDELISADGGLNTAVAAAALLSAQGTVECSSCHDVHNNGPGGVAGTGLYAMDNAGSQMCLVCHAK